MVVALWIAVFVLLIANFCLALKVRRLERKMRVELPVQASSGDDLFHTINTVIKEFSGGLQKIVDLKKFRGPAPEA
jgi:hypothetical protein